MLDLPFLNDLLQPIVGEPLSGLFQSYGQLFEFGEQRPDTNRHGEQITRGDLWLKFIAADWRVVQAGRVILGSTDNGEKVRFYATDNPPDTPYGEEAWRLCRDFLRSVDESEHTVTSIHVGELADVTVRLTGDLVIQSFGSSGQDLDLWWFHNRRTDLSCLVGPSGQNFGQASPGLRDQH